MHRRPRKRLRDVRVTRRTVAYLLAVLLVAVQLVPLLHTSTSGHRVCVEHGELEHVAHAAASGVSGAPSGARTATGGGPTAERSDADSPGDHDGCQVGVVRREKCAVLVPVASGTAEILRGPVPVLVADTRPHRSFDLLFLAPSHSPPA